MQLKTLNLDISGLPVNFIDQRAIIYNMENHKSELKNLNQLKKLLNTKGVANFSDLSNKACWLLEEIVQNLQQRSRETHKRMDIKLLFCPNGKDYCN